jgi:hypothetical protein
MVEDLAGELSPREDCGAVAFFDEPSPTANGRTGGRIVWLLDELPTVTPGKEPVLPLADEAPPREPSGELAGALAAAPAPLSVIVPDVVTMVTLSNTALFM